MRKIPGFIPSLLIIAAGFGIFLPGCGTNLKSASAVSADRVSPAIFLTGSSADPRITDRKFEQVPAVAATSDGKVIYVAWYSGGPAPGPGNYVTVSASLDQGKTWLNDQLVILPKEQSVRFFDPGLWRDKDGKVHLFYGSSKDSMMFDGFGGVNTVEISWNGSKLTHKQPQRIADGVMSNKPINLTSKGLSLIPLYIDTPPVNVKTGVSFPANGAFILSYDYSKKNSIDVNPYSSIKVPDDIRIHDEPQVVELSAKGEFMAMVRTTKGIYFTRSSDYGKTWSPVEPFTASGPTTSSRFYIGKLASGNLLLVANNSTTRNKMTAFLSMDGGRTWPHKLLLDSRENVSYPDADQTSDGQIHVVFDRDRTVAKDILYFRFTEDAIVKGNSELVFKTRVNKN